MKAGTILQQPPAGFKREVYSFNWWQEPATTFHQCCTKARYSYRGPGVLETPEHRLECVGVRVEVMRADDYTGPGLKHTHEFSWIQSAELTGFGDLGDMRIHYENFVEHRVNGELVDRFGWGHDTVKLYGEVHIFRSRENARRYDGRLLGGYRIMHYDLPCCGGRYVSDREITDYSTLSIGHCSDCGAKWEIGDGLHFERK